MVFSLKIARKYLIDKHFHTHDQMTDGFLENFGFFVNLGGNISSISVCIK